MFYPSSYPRNSLKYQISSLKCLKVFASQPPEFLPSGVLSIRISASHPRTRKIPIVRVGTTVVIHLFPFGSHCFPAQQITLRGHSQSSVYCGIINPQYFWNVLIPISCRFCAQSQELSDSFYGPLDQSISLAHVTCNGYMFNAMAS